jgi:nicotinamide-nucleotide adenylyltransferase
MLVPKFEIAFSNEPLTIRLLEEDGIKVVEVRLKERKKFMATEIRSRIFNKQPWEDLVPKPVVELIKEFDGEKRIRELNIES